MKTQFTENIEQLKNWIKEAGQILILTHKNPDGDAMGSSLAMAQYLTNANKRCNVLVPDDVPGFLQWLPGYDKLTNYYRQRSEGNDLLHKADLILCLDFNSLSRIDAYQSFVKKFKVPKVLIDHHPHPENEFDLYFSDTSVSSTAELLYTLMKEYDESLIDQNIAECIYTGILTDTGSFSYNSNNPQTFQAVAELMNYKINRDEIYARVYNTFSFDRMKLMGYLLHEKMQYLPHYHTAFIDLNLAEQEKFNFQPGDSEGFVNLPMSIGDVIFTVFFTEKKDKIKLSLRSRGTFAANKFAEEHFSGGGHFNAAGGESQASMQESIKKFVDLLEQYKDELTQAAKQIL